ncbi:unnamed protein product, partial [Callosobruchus maculatus]
GCRVLLFSCAVSPLRYVYLRTTARSSKCGHIRINIFFCAEVFPSHPVPPSFETVMEPRTMSTRQAFV